MHMTVIINVYSSDEAAWTQWCTHCRRQRQCVEPKNGAVHKLCYHPSQHPLVKEGGVYAAHPLPNCSVGPFHFSHVFIIGTYLKVYATP
eukprot:1451274-Ditylum_brightwellii.AAC.1